MQELTKFEKKIKEMKSDRRKNVQVRIGTTDLAIYETKKTQTNVIQLDPAYKLKNEKGKKMSIELGRWIPRQIHRSIPDGGVQLL